MVGRLDDAEVHFEQALRFNQRMGARPSVVRTQFEYGRMLLSRGKPGDSEKASSLLNDALATATVLGMEALRIRIRTVLDKSGPTEQPLATPAHIASEQILRKEGDFWTVSFDGKVFRIKHIKGLDYIAHSMRYPDRGEFHALTLVGGADGRDYLVESTPREPVDPSSNQIRYGAGDAGEMLDEKAKASYRERIDRLREALGDAKERGDPSRAAAAEDEIEAVGRELTATGWGGRSRRAVFGCRTRTPECAARHQSRD